MTVETLAALSKLNPTDREILVDSHLVGRSLAQIQTTTGLPRHAVLARRLRAERQLARLITRPEGTVPITNRTGYCVGCGADYDDPTPCCRNCQVREAKRRWRERTAA